MVPVVTVWVAGALTAGGLALLINWLLTFIAPPFIIWIKQIHSCRGTEFGSVEGVAGQLLALALSSADTATAISRLVTTTNTLQSPGMRLWRIEMVSLQSSAFTRETRRPRNDARAALRLM